MARRTRASGRAAGSKWPRRVAQQAGVMYDLGCGSHKQPGSIGIDIRKTPETDIVCDLFKFPWKALPSDSAHTVVMHHLFEHIPPSLKHRFMDEVWRIMQVGGKCYLSGPYGWSSRLAQDCTHESPAIVEGTFSYFDPRNWNWTYYQPKPWAFLSFARVPAGFETDFNVVLQKVPLDAIENLAKRRPEERLYGPL